MRQRSWLLIRLTLVFLLASAGRATAQWASLGDMPPPVRDGNTATFKNKQAIVAVSALAPDIIRVRVSPTPTFGRDHSYAVVSRDFGSPGATITTAGQTTTITTAALRVTIAHRPFRVSVFDAQGESLDADDPTMGIAISGRASRVFKRLRPDEHVYGFGEKNGKLNRRGKMQGGYSYAMWNSDTFAYDASTDPLYASVPVLPRAAERPGPRHLPGQHTPHHLRHWARVQDVLSFGADGGELDYYFIDGPRPKQVVERYTPAHRPHAAAAALGARLPPVPVQLLPGVEGPLHRRQLPRAQHPGGRDLARHPLPGRLQALHLGPGALPRSRRA